MSEHLTMGAPEGAARRDDPLWVIRQLAGQRVRVTWPNGIRHSGEVTARKVGVHDVAFLNGTIVGGEYSTAIEIETMAPGTRRYATKWRAMNHA